MKRKTIKSIIDTHKLPIVAVHPLVGNCGVLEKPNIAKTRILNMSRFITKIAVSEWSNQKVLKVYVDDADKICSDPHEL